MSHLSYLTKGKARQEESSSSRVANMMKNWDDSSSSTTTYYEIPSDHFLAQSGGLPLSSTSVYASTSNALRHGANSVTGSKSSQSYETCWEKTSTPSQRVPIRGNEIQSNGSLTSEDRDLLSHIPSDVSQTFLGQAGQLSGGQQPRPYMPDTSTLAAADFDVDVRSGFLPPQPPISRLEGIEEELWECALDKARALPLRIGGGGAWVSETEKRACREWRRSIRKMLVLHPSPQITTDIRFARRAHLVLSWLAHLYIHSQPSASKAPLPSSSWIPSWSSPSQDAIDDKEERVGTYTFTVPAAIAVPWVALSTQLDLPPILTYATTVLWNWDLRDPSLGFTNDNVYITTTFSNTSSEEHFFKTSLLIERKGVAALTLMRRSLDEAFVGDSLARHRISIYLTRLGKVIEDLTQLLHDVRLGCDPATFYWGIRPWFNGGDSAVDDVTGEKGWVYEGVHEYGGKRKVFTGPSAGQSSLIHSLDVFLGVDHAKKEREGASTSERENATFMEKMQFYMPGHHRNFLTHLKNISFVEEVQDREGKVGQGGEEELPDQGRERHPLRALMTSEDGEAVSSSVETLRASYNSVLTSLKHLRDEHMRIATLYIISQMKTSPPREYTRLSDNLVKKSTDIVDESTQNEKGAKGTGGTDLVSFLKDCRKNTIAALHK
ncbi:hypothetical protein CBS101457_006753 [Exobasidium rhododendri]|nr:hypothetical protein CBS101457_006753 [Exobasidium rhododendri]